MCVLSHRLKQVHAAFAGCWDVTLWFKERRSIFIPATSFDTKPCSACSAKTPLCASSVMDGWGGCCHRALIRPIWSAGCFNKLHRIRASFFFSMHIKAQQAERVSRCTFLIVLLNHITPDQTRFWRHSAHIHWFGAILGHATVCKDCDFSMCSYRLTADAQDNELIGDE